MDGRSGAWVAFASLIGGIGFTLLYSVPMVGAGLLAIATLIFIPVLFPAVGRWLTAPIRRARETRTAREGVAVERQLQHRAEHRDEGAIKILTLRREDGATPAAGRCEVTAPDGSSVEVGFSQARLQVETDGDALVLNFPDDFEGAPEKPPSGPYRVVWKQGYVNSRSGDVIHLELIAIDEFDYVQVPELSTDLAQFPAARHLRHKKDCPENPRIEADLITRRSGNNSVVTRCVECGEEVIEMPGWWTEHSEMTADAFGHGLLVSVHGTSEDGIRALRCVVTDPYGNGYHADPHNLLFADTQAAQAEATFHFPGEFKSLPIGGMNVLPAGKCTVVWTGDEPHDDGLGSDRVYVAVDSFWLRSGGIIEDS